MSAGLDSSAFIAVEACKEKLSEVLNFIYNVKRTWKLG
jgi:hypothetical protein